MPPTSPVSSHNKANVPPTLRPRQRPVESPVKTTIFVIILALLVGFVVMYLVGRSQRPVVAKCEGQCILLRKSGADPGVLTVTKGSTVEFASADGQHHNLKLDDRQSDEEVTKNLHASHQTASGRLESGDFTAQESWRVQFKQDGTYSFTDTYNTKIHVDIVVYTPGTDYKLQ